MVRRSFRDWDSLAFAAIDAIRRALCPGIRHLFSRFMVLFYPLFRQKRVEMVRHPLCLDLLLVLGSPLLPDDQHPLFVGRLDPAIQSSKTLFEGD